MLISISAVRFMSAVDCFPRIRDSGDDFSSAAFSKHVMFELGRDYTVPAARRCNGLQASSASPHQPATPNEMRPSRGCSCCTLTMRCSIRVCRTRMRPAARGHALTIPRPSRHLRKEAEANSYLCFDDRTLPVEKTLRLGRVEIRAEWDGCVYRA